MERLLSLLLSIVIFIIALITKEWETLFYLWMYLILAVVAIWYGDDIVESKAVVTSGKTNGAYIRFMGWVLLLIPFIIFVIDLFKKLRS
ncbi:MAG: hypothetical protein Q8Q33_06785 [Chlamydiota bacterium]|nr:hypothetical protein [Chlamydiota bacterium]